MAPLRRDLSVRLGTKMSDPKKMPSVERVRALFDCDAERGLLIRRSGVGWRQLSARPVPLRPNDYQRVRVDGSFFAVHRLIWLHVYGVEPRAFIDHVNGDPGDNRISNLREVTTSQNMQNRHRAARNSKTGLLGVYPRGDRFIAQIGQAGRLHHLGVFDTAEEAHVVYLKAKQRLHVFGPQIGNTASIARDGARS